MSDYESIELTEEETKAAILEAKKKKYFHEKHREYWQEQERVKPSSFQVAKN